MLAVQRLSVSIMLNPIFNGLRDNLPELLNEKTSTNNCQNVSQCLK